MPTYLPWLDLLRYVACVLVILSHLNPFPENNHFGHNGVALFFSISGYLIGSVLMNGRAKPGWVSRFYAHRLLRIYPPLLAGLAVMGAVLAVFAGRPGNWGLWEKGHEFVGNLPHYLTFTAILYPDMGTPYGIVWTLCVEEYFYLLLPLGFWLLGPRGTGVALVGIVIVTLEPRLRLIPGTHFGTWFLIPVNLLTGAVLAVFRPPMRDGPPWAGFLGLAAVLLNAVFGFVDNPFGPIMGLVTTLTVWSFATTRVPVPRPWDLVAKWGKWSYEIYLVHLPFCSLGNQTARELGRRLGLETLPRGVYVVVAAGVATVGATVLAAVLYRLIERPVRAARPWVTNRPSARRLAAAIQVSLVPAGIAYWLSVGGWSVLKEWWRSLVWIWDA